MYIFINNNALMKLQGKVMKMHINLKDMFGAIYAI